MKWTLLLIIFVLGDFFKSYSPQLPAGSCVIVCTYDANGNRLKQVYF